MPETERRGSPRHRTFKPGKIVLNDGAAVLDCTVRNRSEKGALIGIANTLAVPEEFDLKVDGGTWRCVVIWRRFDRLGVRFTQEKSPA